MKLAGLANGRVSGELTWGKSVSPALAENIFLPPGTFKSTVQSSPPELLLQVNVTFPLSGTTYPPGIGSASADRLTAKTKAGF